MKDDKVGKKKLLVARSNKKCKKYMDVYNLYQKIKNRIETSVGKLIVDEASEKP